MAAPSEAMAWKLFPGVPRVCDLCKRKLRIQDVGEHRTYREDSRTVRTVFWCKEHRGGRIRLYNSKEER